MRFIQATQNKDEIWVNADNICTLFMTNQGFGFAKLTSGDVVTIDEETGTKLIKNRWMILD